MKKTQNPPCCCGDGKYSSAPAGQPARSPNGVRSCQTWNPLFGGFFAKLRSIIAGSLLAVNAGSAQAVYPSHLYAARSPLKTTLLLTLVALLMPGILTGCSRQEYRVALNPDEPVPVRQDVLLDGRVVGAVARIQEEGPNHARCAVIRITDRAARSAMRVGVEREQRGAEMRLSTTNVKSGAPQLEPGSAVPTRTPVNHAARKTVDAVRDWAWHIRDSLVEHPLAGIAAGITAIILLLSLLRWLFRRRACCSVWALAPLLLTTAGTAAETGIYYTRDRLRDEQNLIRRYIADAERSNDAATRMLDASLQKEAAGELLCSLFRLDAADVRLEGHLERIGQLRSSPLAYSRSEEQQKLSTAHSALRQQLQNALERAATLRQRCSATNLQTPTALQVFLVKRETHRNRIRNGVTEPTTVLQDCRRLAAFPLPLVAASLVNEENCARATVHADGTVTLPNGQTVFPDGRAKAEASPNKDTTAGDIARLKREAQDLQEQVARLRRAQEDPKRASPPLTVVTNVVVLTNEIRTVIEKLLTAPAPPPVYITNVLRIPAVASNSTVVKELLPIRTPSRTTNVLAAPLETPRSAERTLSSIAAGPARIALGPTNPFSAVRLARPRQTATNPLPRSGAQEQSAAVVSSNPSAPAHAAVVSSASSKRASPRLRTPVLALAGTSAAALGALALMAIIRWTQRRFDVVIARIGTDSTATPIALTLQSKAERIVLGEGAPRVEPADSPHPVPAAIVLNRFGRATITASLARVILRDQVVEKGTARLPIGDQVEVHRADDKAAPETYVLREVTTAASDDAKLEEAA